MSPATNRSGDPKLLPDGQPRQPKVKPFLEVRLQRTEAEADLIGLCAGYETGAWRADSFAMALIRNLPQFALPIEHWKSFNTATGVEQLARAARAIYTTDKYERRGEVGELMLFSIMREHYDSEPIVSKFYFKSSSNETVKGFDAVHVVSHTDGPELWLGEAKFYSNLAAAIRDVVSELEKHLQNEYLRDEFMWVDQKMGGGTSHSEEIRRLLDDNTSLDEVFNVLHVPILLTYKSLTISQNVRVHIVLVLLLGKARLLKAFDERLKSLQSL
jgi:hypothetical protein